MKTRFAFGAAAAALLTVGAFAQAGIGQDGRHGPMKAMTRAEVQAKAAERFAKLDANRDGKVTKAELDAARDTRKAEWKAGAEKRRGEMFARIDTDHDGKLSPTEFAAPRGPRAGDDGRGPRGGMKHGRGGGHGGWGHGGRGAGGEGRGGMDMLARLDANGDGAVTLAEATAGPLAMFDKADANHDGTVTPRSAVRRTRRCGSSGRRSAAPPPPDGAAPPRPARGGASHPAR